MLARNMVRSRVSQSEAAADAICEPFPGRAIDPVHQTQIGGGRRFGMKQCAACAVHFDAYEQQTNEWFQMHWFRMEIKIHVHAYNSKQVRWVRTPLEDELDEHLDGANCTTEQDVRQGENSGRAKPREGETARG